MNLTCPKHQKPLKAWPSGDLYCTAKDPTGPKGFCTFIIKKKDLAPPEPPAPEPQWRVNPPLPVEPSAPNTPDARLVLAAAALHFAGSIYQGQGAIAQGPALALADATYQTFLKVTE